MSEDAELIEFRHSLHMNPELSGMENSTAEFILDKLAGYAPDRLLTDLGGSGIAAVYSGSETGPAVLFRCEMDALQIGENLDIPYRSVIDGVSHKCGHDGHMAILMGLASRLHENRPSRGSVILLFQPAEETGEGALRILADIEFKKLKPDVVFALHNLPGFPKGTIILRKGVYASASRGISIELAGASSHASEPDRGKNPAPAVAQIISTFTGLHQSELFIKNRAMITVIHVRVGERAFGTSPAEGCVLATLRTAEPGTIKTISEKVVKAAEAAADTFGLKCRISWTDEFPVTENSDEAVGIVESAAMNLGLETIQRDAPFPWSEDFGYYTWQYPGALFGMGAGVSTPALHSSEYDFPDELISTGVDIFTEISTVFLTATS